MIFLCVYYEAYRAYHKQNQLSREGIAAVRHKTRLAIMLLHLGSVK